jgi:hypothetical protein
LEGPEQKKREKNEKKCEIRKGTTLPKQEWKKEILQCNRISERSCNDDREQEDRTKIEINPISRRNAIKPKGKCYG